MLQCAALVKAHVTPRAKGLGYWKVVAGPLPKPTLQQHLHFQETISFPTIKTGSHDFLPLGEQPRFQIRSKVDPLGKIQTTLIYILDDALSGRGDLCFLGPSPFLTRNPFPGFGIARKRNMASQMANFQVACDLCTRNCNPPSPT